MNEPIVIDANRFDVNLQEVYDSTYPPEPPADWHGVKDDVSRRANNALFAVIALGAVLLAALPFLAG